MTPVECPYCGKEHQIRPHINILCPCGAKYYIHTREWWSRGGAEAPKPMTNRDYINSLSNEELITWVLYGQQEIGKAYTHSELALIEWLNRPYKGGAEG